MNANLQCQTETTAAAGQDSEINSIIERFIELIQVRPHFHPIVDILTGTVLGYEVLSRGSSPYESPYAMFKEAARLDAIWELEMACCNAALAKIASFPEPLKTANFFVNISPVVFADPRFLNEFTRFSLEEYGIDRRNIIIEITEEKAISNYSTFEKLIAHYTQEGFNIALDDFGSGHSGLITLVASTPHFLKLDMAIVRNVHKHDYKQKLVKAITTFAASVNARLIAEGVECVEELEVLMRYGVRYVQGFLFGTPQPEPYSLPMEWWPKLKVLVEKYDIAAIDLDTRIGGLVSFPTIIRKDEMTCKELDLVFKKNFHLDHIVILDEGAVVGLITRQLFYSETGGAFGYQLLQKKPIETICKKLPLIVKDKMTVTMLSKLAMERCYEDLYDPVLVTDCTGEFLGTVTMKQVLTKSIELEIRSAIGMNPLTGLSGNNVIHRWIIKALSCPEYSIIYADLDNFKCYNDTYGFIMGDELLQFTANILSQWMRLLPEEGKLGHIGGDDFVIVLKSIISKEALQDLCILFDTEKLRMFKSKDIKNGYINCVDRQGYDAKINLVTMSLAVIESSKVYADPNPALFSEIAGSLKKKVKKITAQTGRSGYLFERRVHGDCLLIPQSEIDHAQ
ncbi:MAG: EAL domain-containing protein [Smithellaceae bacterium]